MRRLSNTKRLQVIMNSKEGYRQGVSSTGPSGIVNTPDDQSNEQNRQNCSGEHADGAGTGAPGRHPHFFATLPHSKVACVIISHVYLEIYLRANSCQQGDFEVESRVSTRQKIMYHPHSNSTKTNVMQVT